MEKQELIVEHYTFDEFVELMEHNNAIDKSIIGESVDNEGNKVYTINGIFAQGNVINRNGRYYPKEILDKAMNTYIKEYVNTHRAVGEAEHPKDSKINLLRISHKIEPNGLTTDGQGNWIGKAVILDTDVGRNIKALIDGGVKFGVSTRALGNVYRDNKLGANVVKEGLRIIAIDIVFNPSAPDAFMQNLKEHDELDCECILESVKSWVNK